MNLGEMTDTTESERAGGWTNRCVMLRASTINHSYLNDMGPEKCSTPADISGHKTANSPCHIQSLLPPDNVWLVCYRNGCSFVSFYRHFHRKETDMKSIYWLLRLFRQLSSRVSFPHRIEQCVVHNLSNSWLTFGRCIGCRYLSIGCGRSKAASCPKWIVLTFLPLNFTT